jgi:hypothetical protein
MFFTYAKLSYGSTSFSISIRLVPVTQDTTAIRDIMIINDFILFIILYNISNILLNLYIVALPFHDRCDLPDDLDSLRSILDLSLDPLEYPGTNAFDLLLSPLLTAHSVLNFILYLKKQSSECLR